MPATAAWEGAERVRQGCTSASGSGSPRTGRPQPVRQPRQASLLPWQEHTERRLRVDREGDRNATPATPTPQIWAFTANHLAVASMIVHDHEYFDYEEGLACYAHANPSLSKKSSHNDDKLCHQLFSLVTYVHRTS